MFNYIEGMGYERSSNFERHTYLIVIQNYIWCAFIKSYLCLIQNISYEWFWRYQYVNYVIENIVGFNDIIKKRNVIMIFNKLSK